MRNIGYDMPSLHSALSSLDWMYGIQIGLYYCPKEVDRNLNKRCFHPPPKVTLVEKLKDAIQLRLQGKTT